MGGIDWNVELPCRLDIRLDRCTYPDRPNCPDLPHPLLCTALPLKIF